MPSRRAGTRYSPPQRPQVDPRGVAEQHHGERRLREQLHRLAGRVEVDDPEDLRRPAGARPPVKTIGAVIGVPSRRRETAAIAEYDHRDRREHPVHDASLRRPAARQDRPMRMTTPRRRPSSVGRARALRRLAAAGGPAHAGSRRGAGARRPPCGSAGQLSTDTGVGRDGTPRRERPQLVVPLLTAPRRSWTPAPRSTRRGARRAAPRRQPAFPRRSRAAARLGVARAQPWHVLRVEQRPRFALARVAERPDPLAVGGRDRPLERVLDACARPICSTSPIACSTAAGGSSSSPSVSAR